MSAWRCSSPCCRSASSPKAGDIIRELVNRDVLGPLAAGTIGGDPGRDARQLSAGDPDGRRHPSTNDRAHGRDNFELDAEGPMRRALFACSAALTTTGAAQPSSARRLKIEITARSENRAERLGNVAGERADDHHAGRSVRASPRRLSPPVRRLQGRSRRNRRPRANHAGNANGGGDGRTPRSSASTATARPAFVQRDDQQQVGMVERRPDRCRRQGRRNPQRPSAAPARPAAASGPRRLADQRRTSRCRPVRQQRCKVKSLLLDRSLPAHAPNAALPGTFTSTANRIAGRVDIMGSKVHEASHPSRTHIVREYSRRWRRNRSTSRLPAKARASNAPSGSPKAPADADLYDLQCCGNRAWRLPALVKIRP